MRANLRDMQAELDRLRGSIPDPVDDPHGFEFTKEQIRIASQEMARHTDLLHAWQAPRKSRWP